MQTRMGVGGAQSKKNPFSKQIFLMFIYFERERRERERETETETETDRARVGKGQRERETQNPKQVPGSELSAQSPTWGSNP